jgi:hypothetical protein
MVLVVVVMVVVVVVMVVVVAGASVVVVAVVVVVVVAQVAHSPLYVAFTCPLNLRSCPSNDLGCCACVCVERRGVGEERLGLLSGGQGEVRE